MTALVLLLAAHAWAVHGDLAHEDAQERQGLPRELALRVAAAYAQGQRDAMAALHDRPQGVALAQACLALQGVQP